MGAVEHGVTYRYPVVGSLDNGVLLGVERALAALSTVHDPYETPHIFAVRHPRRTAVVTGCEYPLVPYDHGPYGEPGAGRASRDLVSDAHKELVPRRACLLERSVLPGGVDRWVLKAFHTACPPRRRDPAR